MLWTLQHQLVWNSAAAVNFKKAVTAQLLLCGCDFLEVTKFLPLFIGLIFEYWKWRVADLMDNEGPTAPSRQGRLLDVQQVGTSAG